MVNLKFILQPTVVQTGLQYLALIFQILIMLMRQVGQHTFQLLVIMYGSIQIMVAFIIRPIKDIIGQHQVQTCLFQFPEQLIFVSPAQHMVSHDTITTQRLAATSLKQMTVVRHGQVHLIRLDHSLVQM